MEDNRFWRIKSETKIQDLYALYWWRHRDGGAQQDHTQHSLLEIYPSTEVLDTAAQSHPSPALLPSFCEDSHFAHPALKKSEISLRWVRLAILHCLLYAGCYNKVEIELADLSRHRVWPRFACPCLIATWIKITDLLYPVPDIPHYQQ